MSVDISIKKKLEEFELDVAIQSDAKRIGILGASGSGKSMTLKMLAGIVKPDSGHVAFDDKTLYDSKRKINLKPQQRSVGYLFQNYALFPTMTVAQNVAAGIAGSKQEKEQKVNRLLKEFQIEELSERLPDQLSGGQQQRVALARMLAHEPDVLLFDEPFSALDAYLREGLRLEMLSLLKKLDKTAIIVTHDRDEAYQMCDWLIIMDKGKILASGPTKELFEHPATPAVAKLTGCKNISRIERIDAHTIRLPDWGGIVLTTKDEVTDEIQFAGIRAHDFFAVPEESLEKRTTEQAVTVNLIETGTVSISEMPFEWYVTLENGLWWKVEKSLNIHKTQNVVPKYLSVLPESIILLKE